MMSCNWERVMPRSYNLEAHRGKEDEFKKGLSVSEADAWTDELTEKGWRIVVKDQATGAVISRQEINRRWIERDPEDVSTDSESREADTPSGEAR